MAVCGCGVLRGTYSGGQMAAMNLGLPQNLQVTAIAITATASVPAATNFKIADKLIAISFFLLRNKV